MKWAFREEHVTSGMIVRRRQRYRLLVGEEAEIEGEQVVEVDPKDLAVHSDLRKTIAECEAWAKKVLRHHGLPEIDPPSGFGYVKVGAQWVADPKGAVKRYWTIPAQEGYVEDSPPGFAQRVLWACIKLQFSLAAGNAEESAWNAYSLGHIMSEIELKRW
jgi:hypothetical protein